MERGDPVSLLDRNDPLLRRLSQLPSEPPREAHAHRVRAKCHAALLARAHGEALPPKWPVPLVVANSAVIVALCFYLAQATAEAVRVMQRP
jgi:hypothetical protein